MNRKAQAATEYLIILAVVVIIALIVVAVMGGIPGIGQGAASRADMAYWSTADVAITSIGVSAAGADSVTVKNNLRDPITITAMTVNGASVLGGTTPTIAVGGTQTLSAAIAACTAGQAYAYPVSIIYTDSKTGLSTTFTGDGKMLGGTCTT